MTAAKADLSPRPSRSPAEGRAAANGNLFGQEAKLVEWERFYNFGRPHGPFNGKTPCETL
ncbi:MAG TPA: hypothetical protein ENH55_19940 [Aurantimonas coralicida]|uniref:Integrase catalytic domain-containing protein n=1 Tax=Aurantimonas coralicida TaxID=182270 RepID=A0A9C9TG69_9HYPH|nr:hypothetical protein [Aurantimonas coralicida]HET99402.1 hypothetical protein [Aurantimonas coralicida]